MGQYQRWLHYQEIDRRLRSELEALESELATLQQSMTDHPVIKTSSSNGEASAEQAAPQTQNIVIRALDSSLKDHSPTSGKTFHEAENLPAHLPFAPTTTNGFHEQEATSSNSPITSTGNPMQPKTDETISPPLMNWGALPNFGPYEIEEASPVVQQPGAPSTPHPDMALLPEDMPTFINEHTGTDPQFGLPWWLRSKEPDAPVQETTGRPASIEPEPARTDHLVQRWMERREHLSPQSSDTSTREKPEEGMLDE